MEQPGLESSDLGATRLRVLGLRINTSEDDGVTPRGEEMVILEECSYRPATAAAAEQEGPDYIASYKALA